MKRYLFHFPDKTSSWEIHVIPIIQAPLCTELFPWYRRILLDSVEQNDVDVIDHFQGENRKVKVQKQKKIVDPIFGNGIEVQTLTIQCMLNFPIH